MCGRRFAIIFVSKFLPQRSDNSPTLSGKAEFQFLVNLLKKYFFLDCKHWLLVFYDAAKNERVERLTEWIG